MQYINNKEFFPLLHCTVQLLQMFTCKFRVLKWNIWIQSRIRSLEKPHHLMFPRLPYCIYHGLFVTNLRKTRIWLRMWNTCQQSQDLWLLAITPHTQAGLPTGTSSIIYLADLGEARGCSTNTSVSLFQNDNGSSKYNDILAQHAI